MRANQGDMWTSPPEFEVGDANANCPTSFCHVSDFTAPDCLRYNAVKANQPDDSNRVFAIYQNCTFNVHQITTSSEKNLIFFL